MALLDRATTFSLVKLVIFMVVTAMLTGVLILVIGNIQFGSYTSYKALFTDTTGLLKGDDVRVAGVRVGKVTNVQIVDRDKSEVTFQVQDDVDVTQSTDVTIRYRNMIGQRYVNLAEGDQPSAAAQPTNEVIPLTRTQEALDLTTLFNGFKPLFQALSPKQTNRLAYEIVKVFQGEGGTVRSLLRSTSQVTQTLASKDEVIGNVIDNFNVVLKQVNQHDQQLGNTIDTLQQFVSGLNSDRDAIGSAIDSIDDLTVETADLITGAREPLVGSIKQLRGFATQLNDQATRSQINDVIKILPIKVRALSAANGAGPFLSSYMCRVSGNTIFRDLPGVPSPLNDSSNYYPEMPIFKPTGAADTANRCGG